MPKKKKYSVTVEERNAVTYEVEAASVEEAKAIVMDGRGDSVGEEYLGANDLEDWEVELMEDE